MEKWRFNMPNTLENAIAGQAGDDGTTAFKSCPISCNSCDNNILTKKIILKINKQRIAFSRDGWQDVLILKADVLFAIDINNSYAGLFSNLEDKIDGLIDENR